MRNKLLCLLVMFSLLLFGFAGTSHAGEVYEVDMGEDEEIKIGFVSHQHHITDLFGQLQIGFENCLNETEGFSYSLTQANPTASYRHDEMLNILEIMAEADLDYLVVGPSSLERNEPGLVQVAESGAKLLMIDYPPPEETPPYEYAVLTWAINDHYELGYLTGYNMGNIFKERGNTEPKTIVLWGPADSETSQDRIGGTMDGLADSGINPDYIYEAYADYIREAANDEIERALIAYPEVEFIIGANDDTAMGAFSAVQAAGRDDIEVVGMGGQPDVLENVARGYMPLEAFRDPRQMGSMAANALLLHFVGREDEIERIQYANQEVVFDADDIRELIPSEIIDVDELDLD